MKAQDSQRPTRALLSFRWKELKTLVLRLIERFDRHNVTLTSAGVAFYLVLSIFPALAAMVSLFGLLADPEMIVETIQNLSGTVPSSVTQILGEQALELATQASAALGWGVLVGVLISVWSANRGTKAFITAMNVIYETRETRNFFRLTGRSLLITFLALVVGIAMLIAIVVLPPLLNALIESSMWDDILFIIKWPFMIAIVCAGISALYRFGPDIKDPGKSAVFPGALLATTGWLAISLGFSLYADNFADYNETYGALGGVAIFFMWLLLTSLAMLMGAETNLAIWQILKERDDDRVEE